MKRNIVLIGFMGAGKSMAAKELAKRLNRNTVSTDSLIEKKDGRKISEIFVTSGEDFFRDLEQSVVAQIAPKKNLVIDCGGGIVLKPNNLKLLKKNGILFYLKATPEEIHKRTKRLKHRPLLNVDDPLARIAELLKERALFYEQADYIIDTDNKTNKKVCDEVIGCLSNE